MKLKCTKYKYRHVLVCSGLKKEGVNLKELDTLYSPPEGLLSVTEYDESKRVIIYDAEDCVPLKNYYKQNSFIVEEVLNMIKQFLDILGRMEANRLTIQKIVLDFKYLFYNTKSNMLNILFCPVQNNYSPVESEQIFTFLRDLATNAVIRGDNHINTDKIHEFLVFLKKQQQFSAKAISRFFDNNANADDTVNDFCIEAPSSSKYFSSSYTSNFGDGKNRSSVITTNNPEKTNNLTYTNKSAVIQRNSQQITTNPNAASSHILNPSDTIDALEDETEKYIMQPSDTLDTSEFAFLRHNISGIEYEIPYGECIIGRAGIDFNGNPVTPDLVVTDNLRVSKHHAKICYDGNSYYIIDLAAKNKTMVDNQVIESGIDPIRGTFNGKKTKIENGTKIQLASEGFTFIIKKM